MAEKPISTEEKTKAEGLSIEELDAQVGGLLPDRVEMRRRRRRRRNTVICTLCDVNDGSIVVDPDISATL